LILITEINPESTCGFDQGAVEVYLLVLGDRPKNLGGAPDLWISVLSMWTGYHCGEISSTDSEHDRSTRISKYFNLSLSVL
jgi:hypothetical protein